jgi:hypothetical protein
MHMKATLKRFLWISVYAIAFALVEAAIVVYLRGLLVVTDDNVALGSYEQMEIWREAATLLMLLAVGWLAGKRWDERASYSLFAFGLWDIWYYIWLRVFLDWPVTLLDWDILFLIPLRWWGPVLAPTLIAALICITTFFAVIRLEQGRNLALTPLRVATIGAGGFLAMYTFMEDALTALIRGQEYWNVIYPERFNWPLFIVALVLMAIPGLMSVRPVLRSKGPSDSHKPQQKLVQEVQ